MKILEQQQTLMILVTDADLEILKHITGGSLDIKKISRVYKAALMGSIGIYLNDRPEMRDEAIMDNLKKVRDEI